MSLIYPIVHKVLSANPINWTNQGKLLITFGITLIAMGIIASLKHRGKNNACLTYAKDQFFSLKETVIKCVKQQSQSLFSMRIITLTLCFISLFLGNTGLLFSENHTIVMLRGTCSAGKTSICEKIASQESHWQVIDLDDIYMQKVVELIAITFPKEFEVIAKVIPSHNLYHALKRDETVCKNTEVLQALAKIQQSLDGPLGKDFQANLWKQLEGTLIEQIEAAFHEGKDVLMNSWLSKNGIIEDYFKTHKIINVLVYTPIQTSFRFLQKRNDEASTTGNLYQKRFFGQFFSSFNNHYRLTTEKSGCALAEHKKADVESVFTEGSAGVVQTLDKKDEHTFTQHEINLFELNRIKDEFIPIQAHECDTLFLEPKEQYDLVVCSENRSSEELVTLLFERLNTIQKNTQ
jgi:hypothetical protein